MPYAEHGKLVEVREVAPSPFCKTITRLQGHSVTWVDFLGARMARVSGNVDAMKFVLQEIRDA